MERNTSKCTTEAKESRESRDRSTGFLILISAESVSEQHGRRVDCCAAPAGGCFHPDLLKIQTSPTTSRETSVWWGLGTFQRVQLKHDSSKTFLFFGLNSEQGAFIYFHLFNQVALKTTDATFTSKHCHIDNENKWNH